MHVGGHDVRGIAARAEVRDFVLEAVAPHIEVTDPRVRADDRVAADVSRMNPVSVSWSYSGSAPWFGVRTVLDGLTAGAPFRFFNSPSLASEA
jgi:hypothetical protein